MQRKIHFCSSGSGEVIELGRDFLVEMMSEYRLDVEDMEDMDVGMEACGL